MTVRNVRPENCTPAMDTLLAIYPTARKVEEVLKQQSRSGCRLGHKVLTFPQLVDGLYRDCPNRRPVLSPMAERLAIEEALRLTSRGRDSLFSVSPGVIGHLLELVREFKSAGVEPDDLRLACGALDRVAAARVSPLAEVFSRYQALLDRRGLADRHDREREVLAMLERAEAGGPRPRMLDGVERVLVAEIYDFTLLQVRIVTSLIRLIGDAHLTIQAQPHRVDALRFAELTWNRFVEEESIADQVLPIFIRREGRPGRLGFVLRHLFDDGSAETPPPPDDTIETLEAPDRYREVEEIARAIRRALERPPPETIELRRIAIVARDLTPYAEYLESVFRRYRIPLSLYHGCSPIASPDASLILEILRMPLAGLRRQALNRLLASPLITTPAARYRRLLKSSGYIDRATRPLADCLEEYRRHVAAGIDSSAGGQASLDRGIEQLRQLAGLLEQLDRTGTIADHIGRLRIVLERLDFEPNPRPEADHVGPDDAPYQAWETIAELADAARMIETERELSLEEFAALARDVLAQARTDQSSRRAANAVQAFSVLDARGLDFDLVFILGLEDGGFPHYRGEDPILHDELRVALNPPLAAQLRARPGHGAPAAMRKILRTSNERNSEDRFLFFLALSMPERRLVLSYPRADKQGNPCAPSPFVEEVSRILGYAGRTAPRYDAIEDCFEQGAFLNWSASRLILARPEALAIAERSRLSSIERRIEIERRRERYLALPTRERQASATSHPDRLSLVDQYNGRVQASPRLRDLLLGTPQSPRPWSASRLDELGACGFKFFAARVLRLGEEEEIDYEPSAIEVGGLVHEALRELFSRAIDFSDSARAIEQARDFLEEYRHSAETRAIAREAALFDLKWRDLVQIVEEVVEFACDEFREGAFNQPPLLEKSFRFPLHGRRAAEGGESIDLVLDGRLDRLDFNRDQNGRVDRIRVRDYKTSRNPASYAAMLRPEVFGIVTFQLPLYLMAALERFRAELATGVALEAGYLVLRHRDKRAQTPVDIALVETDPELRGELSIANNIIALAASALRGEFDVDPRQCGEFCAFRRLCRYHKALVSR